MKLTSVIFYPTKFSQRTEKERLEIMQRLLEVAKRLGLSSKVKKVTEEFHAGLEGDWPDKEEYKALGLLILYCKMNPKAEVIVDFMNPTEAI